MNPDSSFVLKNMSVLAYANGFTLWHYNANTIPMSEIKSTGHFDNASSVIAVGDMVLVTASDGGTVLFVAFTGESVTLVSMS